MEIPKPDGRKRKLGIPTVLDRLIQQAVAHIMQEEWDSKFHNNSYGFRPHRNAHRAIRHAQSVIRDGNSWVVGGDLEAFFDNVNHDLLMTQLKAHHKDATLLRLINRYLKTGVCINGTKQASVKGVPQGGPLLPVLSNIVLNNLDWELEKRNLRFARYADDSVIFVRSKTVGERVMKSLQRYLGESLRLTVNTQESAAGRPWERRFLGFTFSRRVLKVKVSDKALTTLKTTVKQLSRRTRGHSIIRIIAELRKSLLGWAGFCSCKTRLPIVRGGQSVFRHCRNTESSARFGQMDSTTITVLYPEAMGQQRLPNVEASGSKSFPCVEYGKISSWTYAVEW